jgi:diketogulonate reductase-like aldo/keto reductase
MTAIDERFSTTTAIPTVALNDEAQMPVLGLGVAKLSDAETESSVVAAIEAGCRLIDTAAACGNEEAVGRAIAASGLPREELFVTTKLGTSKQGFESAQESCKASLDRLGLD